MAQVTTYVCDVCGKQKGEANHWWKVTVAKDRRIMMVRPFDDGDLAMDFTLSRDGHSIGFRELCDQNRILLLDVCGQECVNRKMAEVLK